mmetsp:Transcript_81908/g.142435  ORF Transcript_81908/g.142435 Transcript_81908/m.142435 type:complete len:206 (+) Transcript_81908:1705-2322(+)
MPISTIRGRGLLSQCLGLSQNALTPPGDALPLRRLTILDARGSRKNGMGQTKELQQGAPPGVEGPRHLRLQGNSNGTRQCPDEPAIWITKAEPSGEHAPLPLRGKQLLHLWNRRCGLQPPALDVAQGVGVHCALLRMRPPVVSVKPHERCLARHRLCCEGAREHRPWRAQSTKAAASRADDQHVHGHAGAEATERNQMSCLKRSS